MKTSAKKSGVRTVRGNERRLRIESLERRELLAVDLLIRGTAVPPLQLHPDDVAILGEYQLQARKLQVLSGMYFIPAEGSASLAKNVREFAVMGDMDGKKWNGCEEKMGTAVADATGLVHIETTGQYWMRAGGRGLRVQIVAAMNDTLYGDQLGVDFAAVDTFTVRGQQIADENMRIFCPEPTMFTLMQQTGLIVSASPFNPVGDTIPQGSVVDTLSLDMEARNRDMKVTGLTVSHQWEGNAGDITGVYAALGNVRITPVTSFASNGDVFLEFERPLDVDAGTGVTLTIGAVYGKDAQSGSQHRLTVPSVRVASAVDTLIESGTDATYVLRANVINPDVVAANTSNLRVSLTNFSDPNANGYGVAPDASHIRWADWQDQVALADSVFANWIENVDSEVRGPAYQS
jgi:hypothetical protein